MKFRRRKNIAILTAMVFVVSLGGCGRPRVTDFPTNQNDNQEQVDSQTEDAGEIPGTLQYTLSSSETTGLNSVAKSIKIEAVVDASGYERANIYGLTLKEIDDDYIKELAGMLFDGGIYELERPFEIYSEEELSQAAKVLENEMDENGRSLKLRYDYSRIENALDGYEVGAVKEMEEGQLILYGHDTQNFQGVDPIPYDYAYCTLNGSVDGESWMLWYMDDYSRKKQLIFGSVDVLTRQRDAQYLNIDANLNLYGGNNPCSLEEAEAAADTFLERLGYTDMGVVETNHRVVKSSSGKEDTVNGYLFVFTRSLDESSGVFCMNDSAITSEDGDSEASQEMVLVEVGTDGVEKVTLSTTYALGEKISNGTSMLSFDRIDGVARGYMANNLNEVIAMRTNNNDVKINEVKLCYLALAYDEQYTFVPAWVYFYAAELSGGSYDSRLAAFAINAIDGSIITMPYSGIMF